MIFYFILFSFPDGTVKCMYPDGVEESVFTDGTVQRVDLDGTKTITYKNGEVDVLTPDGRRVRKY
jgi:centromere protein J